MNPIIDLINKRSLKKSIPDIKTGDVVKVSQKIVEGAKTRSQIFEGMVIERTGGNGVNASITVRKIASGVGVEKKFLLNSPNIESVKVLRSSKVRRKKIFFLRSLTGKAAKIKEKQRKMMEEIGLKEDGVVETAETTQELAQTVAEESESKKEKNNDKLLEQKVEEIAEQETPIESENQEPETELILSENTESQENHEQVVKNTNEEKAE